MIFQTDQDAKLFCIEIGKPELIEKANKDWKPESSHIKLFVKKRKDLVGKLKNFRKSQNTKAEWRKYRYKLMKGIRRFHKSTKGKRFHRNLGKFLIRHIVDKGEASKKSKDNRYESLYSGSAIYEVLKSLSSIKTHFYIEQQYYMPISEEVEFSFLFEEVRESIEEVERSILVKNNNFKEKNIFWLSEVVEKDNLLKTISELLGKELEEVEKRYNILEKNDLSVIEILRKLLKK